METKWKDLLSKLSEEIGRWEVSPYFLPAGESFDLERFLTDHGGQELKKELEAHFGTPLNQKFWSSQLAFHRLRKAREEVRSLDARQEEKRRSFLETLQAERKAQTDWFREWVYRQRREQLRVIPGGKSKGFEAGKEGEK